jgi:hypothetical protein
MIINIFFNVAFIMSNKIGIEIAKEQYSSKNTD